MEFSEWLKQKYREWQKDQVEPKTMTQFAAYLGVPATSLSNWVNGGYYPRGDNLEMLAQKLGNEIYQAIFSAKVKLSKEEMLVWFNNLSLKEQQELLTILRESIKKE